MVLQKPGLARVLAVFVAFIGFLALCSEADAQFITPTTSVTSGSGSQFVNNTYFLNSFSSHESVPSIPGLENEETESVSTSHKSPVLAAGLSLILPGLGEYYVGDQIWRGIIFTSLDAVLWYGHFTYLAKGDDSTAAFQAYADTNWLSSKYSDSLNMLLEEIHREYRINDPDDFSQINKAEDTLALSNISPIPMSHRLPPRGSQQYYELISKYIQFTYGWRDAQSSDPNTSAMFQRHAEMRANMNAQYETADYFLFGLIINRVLSAIDAVLLARDHNSAVRLHGDLRL
ncbi:MAG TPA: hypothetical protein VIX80_10450, partial [Candidatus Kapabacteria bacterium]